MLFGQGFLGRASKVKFRTDRRLSIVHQSRFGPSEVFAVIRKRGLSPLGGLYRTQFATRSHSRECRGRGKGAHRAQGAVRIEMIDLADAGTDGFLQKAPTGQSPLEPEGA